MLEGKRGGGGGGREPNLMYRRQVWKEKSAFSG